MGTQHSTLRPERWATFDLPKQLLMIANEMNRASKLLRPEDLAPLRGCYERILALTDLTVQVNPRRGLRRELLRWRDLVAGLYVFSAPDPAAHAAAFRALLQFHPETWKQLPYVTGVSE